MRPDIPYLQRTFNKYNKIAFDGKLIMPPIKLVTARTYFGRTLTPRSPYSETLIASNTCIEISIRYSLSESDYISTMVHEMIHYYIWREGLIDDSKHGKVFHRIMNDLNQRLDLQINTTYPITEEILAQEPDRVRYVCVAIFEDSTSGVMVAAKNRLFDLWNAFNAIPSISSVTWYASINPVFGQIPISVSPRLLHIEIDRLMGYLSNAVELENTGTIIRPRKEE